MYRKDEQQQIFFECIKAEQAKYLFDAKSRKKGEYEYAFVGVEKLCHPYVEGATETLFDSIYRHSFDRTRDIQEYGKALFNNLDILKNIKEQKAREEKAKEIIEKTASYLMLGNYNSADISVSESYFSEKMDIMPRYRANKNNFISLLKMLDRNLLFNEDLARICKTFNNCDNCCNGINCDANKCEHHPFSMLYNLGLLGRLTVNNNNDNEEEQQFLHSKDITYFHEKDVLFADEKTCYIIHPALTKAIEAIKNSNILHFKGFILGKGITVAKYLLNELFADRNILDRETFEEKYYYNPRKM